MPRIAAALSVLATAAFCIGLNIVRYPAVRDQLASIEHVSPSVEPEASESENQDAAEARSSDSYARNDNAGVPDRIVAAISGGALDGESEASWDNANDDSGWANDDASGDEGAADGWDGGERDSDRWDGDRRDSETSYSSSDRDEYGNRGTAQRGQATHDKPGRAGRAGGKKGRKAQDGKNARPHPNRTAESFDDSADDRWNGSQPERSDSEPIASDGGPYDAFAPESRSADPGLVPVSRPDAGGAVRRLPSVSTWQPGPYAGEPSPSRASIPAYPATAAETASRGRPFAAGT